MAVWSFDNKRVWRSGCLTQRAPDGWESPRFQAVFVAQASSVKVALPPPAHPRVTLTVSPLEVSRYGWIDSSTFQYVKSKPMSNLEIAEKCASLLEAQDLNGLEDVLADHFTAQGPTAQLNKQQTISYLRTLFTAFPNMKFGFMYLEEKGYLVTCDIHRTGTHTGFLDLTPFGLSVSLPPTGKVFDLPVYGFVFGVENDKIIFYSEAIREGGGLAGILAQLGVKLP